MTLPCKETVRVVSREADSPGLLGAVLVLALTVLPQENPQARENQDRWSPWQSAGAVGRRLRQEELEPAVQARSSFLSRTCMLGPLSDLPAANTAVSPLSQLGKMLGSPGACFLPAGCLTAS